jgi:AraC family transcriptional activator of pobA
MASPSGVQSFFLYALEERETEERFLHVEAIEDRLEVHHWHVRPHLHRELHQVMMMQRGGGKLLIEDRWHAFVAPVLIVMPPRVVHGFELDEGTGGPVITLAEAFHREIAAVVEPAIAGTLDLPQLLHLDPADATTAETAAAFARIEREYRWPRLARTTAITADMAALFVMVARLRERHGTGADEAEGTASRLFVAFRHLVEDRFAGPWTVADYARALGVTQARLNAACRRVAHSSALAVVHARRLTEAKRLLRYSMMNATEVAYTLGFKDPAYFSRFFLRGTGQRPGAFRARGR